MSAQPYWSWFLRKVLLPMGDIVFAQGMMQRLRFLEEAQWWERQRIIDTRDDALRQLIRVAYEEVPFYRELWKRSAVTPTDIRNAEDLWKIPIATKHVLRQEYPHRTTRRTSRRTYEVSSSGSTGTNFRVIEDSETGGLHRASLMLALEWAGWRIGEPHLQTGITLARSADRKLKDSLLRCHYFSAYDLSDKNLDAALDALERYRIEYVWGYPGSLYCLAQRAAQQGWNRPLRSAVTWGDNLYAHYRRTIETAFSTRINDTYGCGEGIQIAAQCGSGDTYHVHSLDVIVECLDDAGMPARKGELGHIVVTRLHPGPMPLIRYRLGDVGVMGGARTCGCGRGYEILESVDGRDTDIVVTPSGNRLVVHFFTGILEHFSEVDSFQVVQEVPDSIVVRIVPTAGFSKDTAASIVSMLSTMGAADLRIDIETVAEIPRTSSGKRRFVIAKPPREFAIP